MRLFDFFTFEVTYYDSIRLYDATSSVNLNWMKETPDQYLFFDIETTGLSAARSDLYLIGYGTILNDEQFRITLLFNDDGCSEPKMLAAFKDILADYKYLVTYNGDTFDLPYIKGKLRSVPSRRYPSIQLPVSMSIGK